MVLPRPRPLAAAALVALLFGALVPARAEGLSNGWSVIEEPSLGPSRVIGAAAHGCLAGAVELPLDGPGYEPIRLSRHRNYGHPELIAFIERLGRRAQAAGLPIFYVGDMAQPRGGPLPSGHASHQTGIDADIWFNLDTRKLPPTARETVDLPSMLLANYHQIDPHRFGPKQVELLRLAASDPKVDRIFVNAVIKDALCRGIDGAGRGDRSWIHRIRPWYGHDEHFHVRLKCPADSPQCVEQKPVPPGEGCGAEIASWMRHLPPPPPEHSPARHPILPAACRAVLRAP